MINLSQPTGNIWFARTLFLLMFSLSIYLLKHMINRGQYDSLKGLVFPLVIIYLLCISAIVKYDKHSILIVNIFYIKKYSIKQLVDIVPAYYLSKFYKIRFNDGKGYNFQRGRGPVSYLNFNDRMPEAKKIEEELRYYMQH